MTHSLLDSQSFGYMTFVHHRSIKLLAQYCLHELVGLCPLHHNAGMYVPFYKKDEVAEGIHLPKLLLDIFHMDTSWVS